jgi:type IV pilus assembly protein PilB
MATLQEFLAAMPLFAEVHPGHLEQIAAAMEIRPFRQGEVVVREGEPGDALFVLLSGRVAITTRSDDLGFTVEVGRLGPGEYFGEMALLTGDPRSATVTAIEPAQAAVLPRKVFDRVLAQLPQVSQTITRGLARRIAQMNRQQGVSFTSLSRREWRPELYAMAPPDLWRRSRMVPVALDGGTLTVAMVDPGNQLAQDELTRCVPQLRLRPVAVSADDYDRFLQRAEKLGAGTAAPQRASVPPSAAARIRPQDVQFLSPTDERDDRASTAAGADAVTLLSQIFAEALGLGASDIHIEADRGGLAIRLRVEGALRRSAVVAPRAALRALASRIKILAGLDISESRLPQNGRIGLVVGQRDYDVRVATVPSRLGEKVALRILDAGTAIQPLASLIVAEKMAVAVRKCLFRPYGAVVFTGPTGSGKTTTLYAALAERTSHGNELNVMTAEDPVEYYLPGVTQVQIQESVGLTYPEALRAFLRQDPDIIMVGETRDAATARIALEASLTGHLVLTTMHTNDTLSSVVRIREMGIEPFLLANSILCVVAQRLVRRLCPACRRPGTYAPLVMENLRAMGALREGEQDGLFEAIGCDACDGTGYKGRIGLFEMLLFDERVREAVSREQPLEPLRAQLEGHSLVGLGSYARYLLRAGLTVPGEVLRAGRIEQKLGG